MKKSILIKRPLKVCYHELIKFYPSIPYHIIINLYYGFIIKLRYIIYLWCKLYQEFLITILMNLLISRYPLNTLIGNINNQKVIQLIFN